MKIGQFFQQCIPAILKYCTESDPAEFARLQDPRYSKETFDINYPFCCPLAKIGPSDQVRYWIRVYPFHGVPVRVTSQWFNPPTSKSLPLLQRYLANKRIPTDFPPAETGDGAETPVNIPHAARGRYKASAIGNAQNLLIRNVLSRLGTESFSALQWQAVVDAFGRTCAYCGADGELVMDHVVPINRQALGEHRLGNLVPSCHACNARKAEGDFRTFLANDPTRIAAITAHMTTQGYEPIGDHAQLRAIIELAHQDVRSLADRYVAIINTLLTGQAEGAGQA